MIFQEPRVEFIKIQLSEIVTNGSNGGNQAVIAQCDGEVYSTEDCPELNSVYN